MRPGGPLLLVAGLWLALGVAAVLAPALLIVWQIAGLAAAILVVTDWLLARAPPAIEFAREVAGSLPVGVVSAGFAVLPVGSQRLVALSGARDGR